MARSPRTATAASSGRSDDRVVLERELEALRKENAELREKVAKGPTDETWFTPGLLGLLALGLFFALWAKYAPTGRARPAAAVQAPAPGEYNPPAR